MSEVGSMETGKAEDKVSISQRIVDFLLCQETPPENAKPTPKGSACTSPDKWDALRKAAEAATPGPWYVHWGPKNPYIKTVGTEWYVMDQNPMAPFVRLDPDANYIALANPAAILELLSELRGMERGGEAAEEASGFTLKEAFEIVLSQLHGATHGNIFSPDDLCVENCPQCIALRPVATLSVTEGVDGIDGNQKGRP